MKIVIINGSARRGNTLTAIDAFVKGASEKNEIEIIQPDRYYGEKIHDLQGTARTLDDVNGGGFRLFC